jgi:hypothetical protein
VEQDLIRRFEYWYSIDKEVHVMSQRIHRKYTAYVAATLLMGPLLAVGTEPQKPGDLSVEAQAWSEFTQSLETAGHRVLANYPQPTALDKTEGLRYLMQQLAAGLTRQAILQPGEISLLRIGATTIGKWGMDGADVKYQGARLDPEGTYRFSGTLGTARLSAIQLTAMGQQAYQAFGSLSGDQFEVDANRYFEILISKEKPEEWSGPWLPMNEGTTDLLVREYFSDWESERPGVYHLVREDYVPAAGPLAPAFSISMLNNAAAYFEGRAVQWQHLVELTQRHLVNRVQMRPADQGLAANYYGSSWFKVQPEEALVVEFKPPRALLWSIQLGNVWWESLDYINNTSSFNDSQAIVGSDGVVRFVVAHADPGVPNWLDTTGHNEGALLIRMQGVEEVVQPVTKLVPLSELSQHLPHHTPSVTAAERQEEIVRRRKHAALRWAP